MHLKNRLLIPAILVAGLGVAALAQADTVSNGAVPPVTTTASRTITVMGTGYSMLPQSSSSQTSMNINLNTQGSSIPGVVADLQKVEAAIRQALTQIGIPASDVQGQNLNVNGGNNGPFKGQYMGPGPGPGPSQGPSYNAGENLTINNLPSGEESSVLSAVYTAEAGNTASQGFNVFSNNNPQSSEEQVGGDALSEALSMATDRAKIIASRMGVTLGPIQDVQQIQPNGPYYEPNSMPITLQVTFATEG